MWKNKLRILLLFSLITIIALPAVCMEGIKNYRRTDSFEEELTYSGSKCKVSRITGGKSGEYCLKIHDRESGKSGFVYSVTDAPPNSVIEFSIYVKGSSSLTKESMVLKVEFVTTDGEHKSGVLASALVGSSNWTKLNGKLFTKFFSVRGGIDFSVVSANEISTDEFYVDDMLITSDKPAEADMVKSVSKIEYKGNFTMRAAFENETTGGLSKSGNPVSLEVTDEVLPHTGKYCLKVTGRGENWHTFIVPLDLLPNEATASVSLWVKTPVGTGNMGFFAQSSGIGTGYKTFASITAKENTWTEIKGNISLKGVERGSSVFIQVRTTEEADTKNFTDIYVDDLLIISDKPGPLVDDTLTVVENAVTEGLSSTPAKKSAKPMSIQTNIPSLKDAMSEYFMVGSAFIADTMANKNFESLIKKHFNVGTPEGPFHMPLLRNVNTGEYDFTKADAFMDFCMANNIKVIGHCLVWEHAGHKPYLVDSSGKYISRDAALSLMEEHIKTVSEHFNGKNSKYKIHGWDVVNEAVMDGARANELKGYAGWLHIIGEDYVNYAFKFADKYNPDTELYYNDYGLDNADKRNGVYKLVKRLLDDNCRVTAIGMQSHYGLQVNPFAVRTSIEKFASLGVKVMITELDVSTYTDAELQKKVPLYNNGLPQNVEDIQTRKYYELFSAYRDYKDVIDRVTFWGAYDDKSWKNSNVFTKIDYPLPFDRNFQAKDMFWAIVDPESYEKKTGLDIEYQRFSMYVNEKKVEISEDDLIKDEDKYLMPIRKLTEELGGKLHYSKKTGDVTIILNGKILIISAQGSSTLNLVPISLKVHNEEGTMRVEPKEFVELFGLIPRWNEHRNTLFVYNL